jgi:hypothetical protein
MTFSIRPLTDLPELPLVQILEFLPGPDLARVSSACRWLRVLGHRDHLWKSLCLLDWPWFFYERTCELTLLPFIRERLRMRSSISPKVNGSAPPSRSMEEILETGVAASTEEDFSYTPVLDGDFGYMCLEKHCRKDNPYHPVLRLQSGISSGYRRAYYQIATGQYTGILQVLNSLIDRQMSAYMALATFDCKKLVFYVSYQLPALSDYRQGRTILLHPDSPQTSSLIDEIITFSEARKRLRRIPTDLIDSDPCYIPAIPPKQCLVLSYSINLGNSNTSLWRRVWLCRWSASRSMPCPFSTLEAQFSVLRMVNSVLDYSKLQGRSLKEAAIQACLYFV